MRRITRAARIVLFSAGVGALLWLPVSLWGGFAAIAHTPGGVISVHFSWGQAALHRNVWRGDLELVHFGLYFPGYLLIGDHAVLPHVKFNQGEFLIGIPLWLLAFLCLAWPVTSFVIARRRRRGRGFPVEAKAGSAVSTVDS